MIFLDLSKTKYIWPRGTLPFLQNGGDVVICIWRCSQVRGHNKPCRPCPTEACSVPHLCPDNMQHSANTTPPHTHTYTHNHCNETIYPKLCMKSAPTSIKPLDAFNMELTWPAWRAFRYPKTQALKYMDMYTYTVRHGVQVHRQIRIWECHVNV